MRWPRGVRRTPTFFTPGQLKNTYQINWQYLPKNINSAIMQNKIKTCKCTSKYSSCNTASCGFPLNLLRLTLHQSALSHPEILQHQFLEIFLFLVMFWEEITAKVTQKDRVLQSTWHDSKLAANVCLIECEGQGSPCIGAGSDFSSSSEHLLEKECKRR